jgi:multidrug efflux pump subunit AcrA (membrane-fusion protein)
VLAPFDGRITRVEVAVGDRVRPGDSLVSLYDLEALEVRAQIPSRHLARVRGALSEGAELTAVATLDGRPLELRLDRLGGAAATASGGVDALFKLERTSALLTLGRTVALNLRLPREQGVVELPFEALYGLDRIYRLQGDRMQGVRVERVGERRSGPNSRVLVRSADLQAGDRVVVTQLPNAMDGLRVQVRVDD